MCNLQEGPSAGVKVAKWLEWAGLVRIESVEHSGKTVCSNLTILNAILIRQKGYTMHEKELGLKIFRLQTIVSLFVIFINLIRFFY